MHPLDSVRLLTVAISATLLVAILAARPRLSSSGHGQVFLPLAIAATLLMLNAVISLAVEEPATPEVLFHLRSVIVPLATRTALLLASWVLIWKTPAEAKSSPPSP